MSFAMFAAESLSSGDLGIIVLILALACLGVAVWLGMHHNVVGAVIAVVVGLILLVLAL